MFFPTMPHDELFETAAVSRVGWIYSKGYFVLLLACACYSLLIECKNGHPFVVTEVSIIIIIIMQLVNYMYSSILCLNCGRPMQLTNCRECGEPIGGRSHKLTKGNVEYKG